MRHAACTTFFLASMTMSAVLFAAPESAAEAETGLCKVTFTRTGDTSASGIYRGECKEGIPHGVGTVTFNNGDEYRGTFADGVIEGEGKLTAADGSVYSGDWQDGKRSGEGTFTWARGSRYVGEWLDDERHGKGTFTWANGNRFEGEFRHNKQYNGKYFTNNGRVYRCRLGKCQ